MRVTIKNYTGALFIRNFTYRYLKKLNYLSKINFFRNTKSYYQFCKKEKCKKIILELKILYLKEKLQIYIFKSKC